MPLVDATRSLWKRTPIVRPLFWAMYRFCYQLCVKIATYRFPNKDVTVDLQGMRILVRNPRRSVIGRSIYSTGIWEKDFTDFLMPRVHSGMTALDVGGDIGYFTLLFSQKVGPQGKVYVFEPAPQPKQYLDHNIALNNLENVECIALALSNAPGRVVLELPFKKSRISLDKATVDPGDVEVEMKTYDRWAQERGIGAVHIVKIDVEGAELLVLQGMRETLAKYHPAIAVEIHPEQIRTFGHTAEQLVEYLKSFGYRPTPIDKSVMTFDQGNITVFWEI